MEVATKDMAGVLEVEVTENEGDDLTPFAKIPMTVDVLMDADASATQILAVFDEYADEVADGHVQGIELVMDSRNQATLVTGADTHATDEMVEDLLEAGRDANIIEYRRMADPVLPAVEIALSDAGLDDVVAVADRYRDVKEVELVQVASNDFIVIRDEVNADPALEDAREQFVTQINQRVSLTGAVVSGRGVLRLYVATTDLQTALGYLNRQQNITPLGKVNVDA